MDLVDQRQSRFSSDSALPIADGPPDHEIWAYFLGKADQTELEVGDGAENSKGGNIKKLVCVSSLGEYSC